MGRGRRIGHRQQPDPPLSFQAGAGTGKGRTAVSFYGEFTQKIDGKGRVSIPVDFRRALEQGDPDWTDGLRPRVRIVYGDPRRKFLECYTISAIREVEAQIRALPRGSQTRRLAEQFMISGSDTCEVDNDGRIVLSQKLRDRIRLRDGYGANETADALFAGTLDTFQIWRPDDYEDDKAARIAAMADDLPPDVDVLTLLPALGG